MLASVIRSCSAYKKFGPLKCWWEFNGERSLSCVKKHVPKGGNSYDKCVMRSYSEYESNKMQEAYCFSLGDINSKKCTNRTQQQQKINNEINDVNTISTKENKLQYSDEKFLLLDKIGSKRFDHNDIKFNPFKIRCLLEQFLLEIKKQCRSKPEVYYKSPLFRMYVVFHFHKNTKLFRTFDFYDFLEYNTTDFYNSYKKISEIHFYFIILMFKISLT